MEKRTALYKKGGTMNNYMESVTKQFEYYKLLGEQTFSQLSDHDLNWRPNEDCNSITTIVKHMAGNMISRWTDFLTSDGEKDYRDRDGEFEQTELPRAVMMELWASGWSALFNALGQLQDADLGKIIYIRNQGHTVLEAINRQLAHYPYHIGQIVHIGKSLAANWESLSIPKGGSKQFNDTTFAPGKRREHYTESKKGE